MLVLSRESAWRKVSPVNAKRESGVLSQESPAVPDGRGADAPEQSPAHDAVYVSTATTWRPFLKVVTEPQFRDGGNEHYSAPVVLGGGHSNELVGTTGAYLTLFAASMGAIDTSTEQGKRMVLDALDASGANDENRERLVSLLLAPTDAEACPD